MDTNYTTKSQEAISGAMQAAAAAGNPQIEPAHLLVELLSQPDGVAAGLLAAVEAASRAASRAREGWGWVIEEPEEAGSWVRMRRAEAPTAWRAAASGQTAARSPAATPSGWERSSTSR